MRSLIFLFILVNSLIFTFVVPPFQKPDEDVKFYHTVALAHGPFYCYLNNKKERVISIPRKYYELPILFRVDEIKFDSDKKLSLNISELKSQSAKIGDENVETSKACISDFIGFIPNTVGFLLSTPMGDPLIQFYIGRLAGFILFLLSFWYALRIIPRPFHIILYLYAALPMVLHQVTAYSDDVLFLSMVILVFSYLVRLYSDKFISVGNFIFYQISIQLLILSKPIALPFIFLHIMLPGSLISKKKPIYLMLAVIFFILSILFGLLFYLLLR